MGVSIALALAARAARLFAHTYPPGIDAGYYPLQSRGLLLNGTLPYSDLPLFFWLNAGVAKVAMLAGQSVDDATLLASQLVDAATQPWAAIPLAAVVLACIPPALGVARRAVMLAATLALAVLSAPILRMVGDFEKNSLGLVFTACAIWAVHRLMANIACWMSDGADAASRNDRRERPTRSPVWASLMLVASLALAALTHIGAFGVTLLVVAASLGAMAVRVFALRRLIAAAGVGLVAAAALWGVVYLASPQKAMGLLQGPVKMLVTGDRASGTPAFAQPREAERHSVVNEPQPPEGRGPPIGPPGGLGLETLPRAALWIGVIALGWYSRRLVIAPHAAGTPDALSTRLPSIALRALLEGLTVALACITFPLIQGTYVQRFLIMTPVLLAVPLAAALAHAATSPARWLRLASPSLAALIAVVAASSGLLTAFSARGPGGQVVRDDAAPELLALRDTVPTDGSAVVLARHGLQWWAGYFLHTPVREEHATAEQLAKYSRVFILNEKPRATVEPPGDRRGPRGDERRRPSPMGESIAVPAGATLLHDGAFYTLHEAPQLR